MVMKVSDHISVTERRRQQGVVMKVYDDISVTERRRDSKGW